MLSARAHKLIGTISTIAVLVGALPLLGLVEIEIDRHKIAGRYTPGETYFLPPARVMQALSFGYHQLAADLLWVRTIAYFADHVTSDHDLSYLKRYIDTILALDEHFRSVYRFGSAMLMSRGARQTNADVFAAIDLLKRGHNLFPDAHQFPMMIGAYYLTELKPSTPSQKKRWRLQAAEWVRRAALIGFDAPWLPNLAAQIYTEQGERELAIRHLKELYMVTPDEQTRTQIAAKLKTLAAAQIDDLRSKAKSFEQEYRGSDIRFIPPDLYAVLRVPQLTPFNIR